MVARTIDPQTHHCIIYGRKVTAPPKSLDRLAYQLDSWLVKRGYIMYSKCVADEVSDCLEHPDDLLSGPGVYTPFAVSDASLVTTRTYFDVQEFGKRFVQALHQRVAT